MGFELLKTFPVVQDVRADLTTSSFVSGLHSGNLGDIIYALPTCKLLGVNHLIINVCSDPGLAGRVMTEASAKLLVPLLLNQCGIKRVTIVRSQVPWEYCNAKDIGVDYVLDSFRLNFATPSLHLVYQHALPFNLHVNPNETWLEIEAPDATPHKLPYLAISLTHRYRRFDRFYFEGLLKNIPPERIYFIGIEDDQSERMNIPGHTIRSNNFLELAELIKGAALFIGNPSFAYALAEGMKVPRLVDLPVNNNVYPLDASGNALHMLDVEVARYQLFKALGLDSDALQVLLELKTDTIRVQNQMNALQQRLESAEQRVLNVSAQDDALRTALDAANRTNQLLRTQLEAYAPDFPSLAGSIELRRVGNGNG